MAILRSVFSSLGSRRAFVPPALPDPPVLDPFAMDRQTPPSRDIEERILIAARCPDSRFIPRVRNAGEVIVDASGARAQIMHNGLRVVADGYNGDWMTRLIALCGGVHEPQEERMFHAVMSRLPPGGAMIEIGGYWAFYSMWFLSAAAGRRAVLLEPDPAHIAVGEANLALNGLSATFIQGYVGDRPGLRRPFRTEKSGVIDLPCHDVASLMAAADLDRLSVLHCDAQGAEFAVLRQAEPLLRAGRVDWVFVSTHHHHISGDPLTHQRCLALLRSMGATIEAQHDVQESFSGDGLIVARFCPPPRGWKPVEISYNRSCYSLMRDPLFDLAEARPPVWR